MIKKISKLLLYILVLIILLATYFSFFGLETKRFNELIKKKIIESTVVTNIELNNIKLTLKLLDLSINIKTIDPKVFINSKKIELNEIRTNLSIRSFLNQKFSISFLDISVKETKIKDILSAQRAYKDNAKLFILEKLIEDGYLVADIRLNFDTFGTIKDNFEINGHLKKSKLKLFNKKKIENLNFEFVINKNNYVIKNLEVDLNKIKFFSKLINFRNFINYISVSGDIKNLPNKIDPRLFNIQSNDIDNLIIGTNNNFSFNIDDKYKISKLKIKSKINLKSLQYRIKNLGFENFIPNFDGIINFNNNIVEVSYDEILDVKGEGKFLINDKSDVVKYYVKKNKDIYDFNLDIGLNNNQFKINSFNYKKEKKINSNFLLKGKYNPNKSLFFDTIRFIEGKNSILVEKIKLDKNFKITYVDKIELDFINNNNIKNLLSIKRNKNDYQISGKSLDASQIIDNFLNSDKKNDLSNLLNDLNSIIDINIEKTHLDRISILKDLKGKIIYFKGNLNSLSIDSNFSDDKIFKLSVKTNKNEKITTLYSDFAQPFVRKYQFVKGFEEGALDFQSIQKEKISSSKLKIYNFKLQKLPTLTKILTLASLQGIADLLTGEGIRFSEFEMDFKNQGEIMTISEIYAIGPAISILMDGYVENKGLISLRGTLVPATTINKAIGSIPILGDILVGKKTGEGVFGVSFKIKGPPKNLKTTVNPIKTLTPRFITRTLEKIKKTN